MQNLALALFHLLVFSCTFLVVSSAVVFVSNSQSCQNLGDGSTSNPYCSLDLAFNNIASLPNAETDYIIVLQQLVPDSPASNSSSSGESDSFLPNGLQNSHFLISTSQVDGKLLNLTIQYESEIHDNLEFISDCRNFPMLIFDFDLYTSFTFSNFSSIIIQNANIMVKKSSITNANPLLFAPKNSLTIKDSCISGNGSADGVLRSLNITGESLAINNTIINASNLVTISFQPTLTVNIQNINLYYPNNTDDGQDIIFMSVPQPTISILGSSNTTTTTTITTTVIFSGLSVKGGSSVQIDNILQSYQVYLPSILLVDGVGNVSISDVSISGVFEVSFAVSMFLVNNTQTFNLSEWTFSDIELIADDTSSSSLNVSSSTYVRFVHVDNTTSINIGQLSVQDSSFYWSSSSYSLDLFTITAESNLYPMVDVQISDVTISNATFQTATGSGRFFVLLSAQNVTDNPFAGLHVSNIMIQEQSVFYQFPFLVYEPQVMFVLEKDLPKSSPITLVPQRSHELKSITIKDSSFNASALFVFTAVTSTTTTPIIESEKVVIDTLVLQNSVFYSLDYLSGVILNDAYFLNATSLTIKSCSFLGYALFLSEKGKVSTYVSTLR